MDGTKRRRTLQAVVEGQFKVDENKPLKRTAAGLTLRPPDANQMSESEQESRSQMSKVKRAQIKQLQMLNMQIHPCCQIR